MPPEVQLFAECLGLAQHFLGGALILPESRLARAGVETG
jgi:hypothetical protein